MGPRWTGVNFVAFSYSSIVTSDAQATPDDKNIGDQPLGSCEPRVLSNITVQSFQDVSPAWCNIVVSDIFGEIELLVDYENIGKYACFKLYTMSQD